MTRESPLDITPIIQAVTRPAEQGGVSSTYFIMSLAGWALMATLSLTFGWMLFCSFGFSVSYFAVRALTTWDPWFWEVLMRHMFQEPYYPARDRIEYTHKRVKRRTTYLK